MSLRNERRIDSLAALGVIEPDRGATWRIQDDALVVSADRPPLAHLEILLVTENQAWGNRQ